ncbi:MAG: type II secretion system F family protein [Candidatus Aenigmatarchaeota archaeon]
MDFDLKKINIKFVPLIAAAMLCLVGLLFYSMQGIMLNFFLLAAVVGIIPYVLINYFDFKKIKDMEDRLPTFLLDLSESQKVGMTLPEALKQVSRTDYGKLTGEVKKMNDQISWGIPVQDVMNNFAKRTQKSKLIGRIVRIIVEAYNSGGDIARTMEATASDLTTIRETEKERKAVTTEHMMIMYAIFFIFIGIVIGLSKTLIPMLELNIQSGATGGIMSFQDPCTICASNPTIFCIICTIFATMCNMFALGEGGGCYYNALFMLMVIIQGIFTGLVAGQIGEGSVSAGAKHSIIMTFSGFFILLAAQKLI